MFTNDLDLALREATALYEKNQVFILADENTKKYCLPIVQETLQLPEEQIMCLPAGEHSKTLASIEQIWQFLFNRHATRHSLMLNLGGGMITDLGGFAAATFKRGLDFVNIPTTLLCLVDAAVGGKTGFNYAGIKNSIGLFAPPKNTIGYTPFLKTLPNMQLLDGFAEMIKHALLASPLEVDRLMNLPIETPTALDWGDFCEIIQRSQEIKGYIVDQDPEEKNARKTLNFGHTFGHAFEELAQKRGIHLSHGYAVAYGLYYELQLSEQLMLFPADVCKKLQAYISKLYGKLPGDLKDFDTLYSLMCQDKKNVDGEPIFTLLRRVGNANINIKVDMVTLRQVLEN